jgi:hypothetical protein
MAPPCKILYDLSSEPTGWDGDDKLSWSFIGSEPTGWDGDLSGSPLRKSYVSKQQINAGGLSPLGGMAIQTKMLSF